eukprot:1478762-Rhodomonas_salina.2
MTTEMPLLGLRMQSVKSMAMSLFAAGDLVCLARRGRQGGRTVGAAGELPAALGRHVVGKLPCQNAPTLSLNFRAALPGSDAGHVGNRFCRCTAIPRRMWTERQRAEAEVEREEAERRGMGVRRRGCEGAHDLCKRGLGRRGI